MSAKKLQVIIPLAVLGVCSLAFIAHIGLGDISAFGLEDIAIICPLGALGVMLAEHTLLPRPLISLAIAIVLILIFARSFCGWVCPVPVVSKIRDLFKKNPAQVARNESASGPVKTSCQSCSGCADGAGKDLADKAPQPSRYLVLGTALVTTFIFGFPVFCVVCPIGLTFAAVFMVFRLFAFGDLTLGIVFVVGLLLVEVVFFKKWCHVLCPLGGFIGLVGHGNKVFRPTVNKATCLESKPNVVCGLCAEACPEGIDPRHPERGAGMNECTKCRACVEACPTKSISMPFLAPKPEAENQRLTDNRDNPSAPMQNS